MKEKLLFEPHLDILPTAQQKLWPELLDTPDTFTLYGGTALALRLGHRESIDFDFFGKEHFKPTDLIENIQFLENATITQNAPNTLSVIVDRSGSIKISFFGVPKLPILSPPNIVETNNLKVASLLDLAGTKIHVVQQRAEAKDYIDIDAILTKTDIDLPTMISAGKALYGHTFSPENALKALCYFEDGNVSSVNGSVKDRLVKTVTKIDLGKLPLLNNQLSSFTTGKKP